MSNGYPDHTWRPGEYVTRGQFVRFALSAVRIGSNSVGNVYQHFTDVPRDSPYYGWVETAFHVKLVQGYAVPSSSRETLFGLYDLVTREQATAILMRSLLRQTLRPSTTPHMAPSGERAAGSLHGQGSGAAHPRSGHGA